MVAAGAVVACLLAGAPPAAAGPAPETAAVRSTTSAIEGPVARIVVSWAAGVPAADRAGVRDRHGLHRLEALDQLGAEVVTVPAATAARVVAGLAAEPAVAVAEPDHVIEAATDDPRYLEQWGLESTSDIDVDAPEAWQITRGDGHVVVAVLDTGVDTTHPDLAPNIWRNPGEVAGNGIDDDGNGYVDDVNGWDFRNDDATVFDSPSVDRHGTHVAGIIAAAADNGIGVAGVAPGVSIMPVKILGSGGQGTSSDAAAAVAYAEANGATVINASWSGVGATVLRNAIAAASDVLVVAAAGNNGVDVDATGAVEYPAGWANDTFGLDNVVSVTAVDRSGGRPSYANHGADSVDLGAPGHEIVSTVPGEDYATISGTSMSTPFASGVAALVASAKGSRGAGLASHVKGGVTPLASMAGVTTTGGFLNAAASVGVPAGSGGGASAPPPPPSGGGGSSPTPAEEPDPAPSGPDAYEGPGARSLEWACPGVTTSGFTDVPAGTAHAVGVGCAHTWGVVAGSDEGRFDPARWLTRGQLASILSRAIETTTGEPLPPGTDRFDDDDGSTHEAAIDRLAEAGVVAGIGAARYAPAAPVTRAQFAAMLARTHQLLVGALPAGADAFFDDDASPHHGAINGLVAIGVVVGTGDGRYEPGLPLIRAQAATMVARLIDALVEAGVAEAPSG